MILVSEILQSVGVVLYYTWWFWLAIILWPLFEGTWLFWRREVWKEHLEFMMFELRMPRAITKSAAAMEQIFIAIHALRNGPDDFSEYWLEGEVTRWYSFEMLSVGGEIRFFLRCPRIQGELIKAAFFSYYPDIELTETDDYVPKYFPKNTTELFKNGYDAWGSELVLTRDDVYPIRSYLEFESPEEEKQYDPMSMLIEMLGRAKREEIVGIQINFFPVGNEYREHGEKLVEKLRSKKREGKAASAAMRMEFPHILPVFPVEGKEGKEENEFARALSRTPGETDVLKAIEENLGFPAFTAGIRFLYFSPKEIYQDTFARRGLISAFNQYGAMDLNAFVRNNLMSTRARVWNFPYVFPNLRVRMRKDRLMMSYPERELWPTTEMGKLIKSKFLNWEHSKEMILTARSLATVFHPPTHLTLTAPHMRRIESRKAGAPAGLPIYGNEEEIEKYR